MPKASKAQKIALAKKYKLAPRRGNMKKTTQRGAYNPQRKKQFMIRRAPMVETKTKTTEHNTVMFGTHPRIGFEA